MLVTPDELAAHFRRRTLEHYVGLALRDCVRARLAGELTEDRWSALGAELVRALAANGVAVSLRKDEKTP